MARVWRTRRFYRVPLDSPVRLRVNRAHRKQVHLVAKDLAGKLLDISEGGCGVEVGAFMPKAARVNVFIGRSELSQAPVVQKKKSGYSRILAAVVGCSGRGPRKYRLGLQFIKVSKIDQEIIADFVKHHDRRQTSRDK